MIVKTSRGGRTAGLMAYLAGPGKHNEHTNPHVVAGHDAVTAELGNGTLDTDAALDGANLLDRPMRAFDVEVTAPVKVWDEQAQQQVKVGTRPAHVWHTSLALGPDDGVLGDAKWHQIATEFVARMGFAGDDTTAPCRWVAVHHGQSSNGNDHVHIVVNLVREDGTKASVHNDFKRASKIAADLERKHGLRVVEGREQGAAPGIHRSELERRARGQMPAVSRTELARRVRAVAAASADEKTFVDGLRDARVLVRPRFDRGSRDRVVGYSVALVPEAVNGRRGDPVWFAPSKLDATLGLGRLRDRWGVDRAGDPSLVGVWRTRHRDRTVAAKVTMAGAPEPAAAGLKALNEHLARGGRPGFDKVAAADAAGVLARASLSREHGEHGPLARASDALARAAQPGKFDRASPHRSHDERHGINAAYRARLIARGVSGDSSIGWAAVLRQVGRTASYVQRAQQAQGRLAGARSTAAAMQAAAASLPALAAVSARRPTSATAAGAAAAHGRDASEGHGIGD
ncbi:relaxase/mobilization nuclease domain-containing protein [Isoptericola sp. NPDC055881]